MGIRGGSLPRAQDFTIEPSDVVKHEKYAREWNSVVNDVALVRLPREAELNRGVRQICLPFLPSEWPTPLEQGGLGGHDGTVVGWGYTKYDPWGTTEPEKDERNVVPSKTQQKLVVPLLRDGQCGAFQGGINNTIHLCAGGELGKDTCKGDSGGPLFYRDHDSTPWYLVGVVSYGTRQCGSGEPGVYTRINAYIPWILKNIGNK